MDYTLFKTKDNAEGQLDSGISASTLIITLKTDEGAEFPEAINGNATSVGSGILLNATGIGATAVAVGDFIYNLTDGSHAFVTAKATNSLSTTQLLGGSDNLWQSGDEYVINPFIVTLNKRTNGVITTSEKVFIKERVGDFLTANERGYDSSTPQPFLADDYVSLFAVSKIFEGLQDALGEQAITIQSLDDTKADIAYVETLLQARNWKNNVRIALISNVTLATALEAGDTQDGVVLALGDRIGLFGQTDAKENGLYTVNSSGAPTRTTDFDASAEITNASVAVKEGTTNADTIWMCTGNDPVIGTDNIEFVKIYPSVQQNPFFSQEFIAKEAMAIGDSFAFVVPVVLFGYSSTFIGTNNQNTGRVTTFRKLAQKITVATAVNSIKAIKVRLTVSAPLTDNLKIRIETNNSGFPSGTLVDANAIATIAGSIIPTESLTTYEISFLGTFNLAIGTYHIVFERDGALNDSNFYRIGYDGDIYAGGNVEEYTGSWANDTAKDLQINLLDSTGKSIKKTNANDSLKLNFVGISEESVSIDGTFTGSVAGVVVPKITGSAQAGDTMYLSDTAGEVKNTAGTNSVKVGKMLSATEMLIVPLAL